MAEQSDIARRIGPVRVGIRRDLTFTRQILGGAARYVVHDPVAFKNHTFSCLEYRILTAIVPDRSIAEVFASLVEPGHLQPDDEAEFYRFVVALHGMGVLQLPFADAGTRFARHTARRAARRPGPFRSLIYHRVPLIDPDAFLVRTRIVGRVLFSGVGVAAWSALVLVAVWTCWGRFDEMFGESSNLLALANIPVLYIALVVLKVLHEFGHAYACRRFGGEVPEMGVALILGAPCAYVDASASWKFDSARQRVLVGLAGMYVESLVAAVFALIWAGTQPGFVHDVAVTVLVLASLVTVLFNINPLMRFDGYYVLTDLLGTPNLWERSSRFIRTGAKRLLLGLRDQGRELPRRERALYAAYGIAAVAYKATLAVGIVAMVALSWPVAGTMLGVVFGYMMLVLPTLRTGRYLLWGEETAPVRRRAYALVLGASVVVPLVIGLLPISWAVIVPGVLEVEDAVVLRAPADGFVGAGPPRPGVAVRAGQPLVELVNPALVLEADTADAALRAEQARLFATELIDPGTAAAHRARVEVLRGQSARLRQRLADLRVAPRVDGRLVACTVTAGDFVRQGDPLAEVHAGPPRIRIVLSDAEVGRTSLRVGARVRIRWTVRPGQESAATVRGVLPSASRDEVPTALTVLGGGAIYGAGADGHTPQLRAEQPYLHVLLEPDRLPLDRTAGLTVQVRVGAEPQTLGGWIYRRLIGFYLAWRMS